MKMESPYPKSSSSAGGGQIVAKSLPGGGSGLETLSYQYPLKLISPSTPIQSQSVLVFLLSYGGGLVGGDTVSLSIAVHRGARLSLVTQGHTKIFKSPSPDIITSQALEARIGCNAGLCLLPDPVQPFESSVYTQKQIFCVHEQASLCLLDWVTRGRKARGEDWSFVKWTGRNEVWMSTADDAEQDRLLVRDAVTLSGPDSQVMGRSLKDVMHNMDVVGTLILRGPLLTALGDFFVSEFDALPRLGARNFHSSDHDGDEKKMKPSESEQDTWRRRRVQQERDDGVLWSAARVRGCVVVKFGARSVEAGRSWIGSMLVAEGSISALFGNHALMCVE